MIDWKQQRVLVTGGTGSFGNFIVRRLLDLGTKEVRVMSRDEKKQYDMRVFYERRNDLTFALGDIRDRRAVDEAIHGIQIVFQAAALKQVTSCENYPMEAIWSNVIGVENVIESALEQRVSRVIAISTDKAVKPVNVMGMTKALQEKLLLRANRSRSNAGTILACVRYGNVLRSRGSVVPFFRDQLRRGKKLTITDARMTRFLLTLNDAIDLVLYAADHAAGGEIFVRKAPAVRVLDLARVMAEDSGKKFEYELIGILPGEKINEILISEEELRRAVDCGDYYRVDPWWKSDNTSDLSVEFSSHHVTEDPAQIRTLIERADREFEALEMPVGEFVKF